MKIVIIFLINILLSVAHAWNEGFQEKHCLIYVFEIHTTAIECSDGTFIKVGSNGEGTTSSNLMSTVKKLILFEGATFEKHSCAIERHYHPDYPDEWRYSWLRFKIDGARVAYVGNSRGEWFDAGYKAMGELHRLGVCSSVEYP